MVAITSKHIQNLTTSHPLAFYHTCLKLKIHAVFYLDYFRISLASLPVPAHAALQVGFNPIARVILLKGRLDHGITLLRMLPCLPMSVRIKPTFLKWPQSTYTACCPHFRNWRWILLLSPWLSELQIHWPPSSTSNEPDMPLPRALPLFSLPGTIFPRIYLINSLTPFKFFPQVLFSPPYSVSLPACPLLLNPTHSGAPYPLPCSTFSFLHQ